MCSICLNSRLALDEARQHRSDIPTPEGESKMSAVILQLAEPLLKQYGKTAERAKTP